jgi:hypothetical protein
MVIELILFILLVLILLLQYKETFSVMDTLLITSSCKKATQHEIKLIENALNIARAKCSLGSLGR